MSTPTTRRYDVRRLVATGTAFDAFYAIASGCGRDDDTPEERALYLVHGYLMEVPHGGHRVLVLRQPLRMGRGGHRPGAAARGLPGGSP